MAYDKCPECGETNHYVDWDEDGDIELRYFDCGFACTDTTDGPRRALCARKKETVKSGGDGTGGHVDDNQYRLAIMDAAQIIDTIAIDMKAAGQEEEFIERCRQLAYQLRTFAGHDGGARSFDDVQNDDATKSGGLSGILRRVTNR